MENNRTLTPWLDTDLTDMEGEEWRDVVGYDGIYNVSSYGRIKSLARRNMLGTFVRARIMRQKINKAGDTNVNLHCDGIMKTMPVLTLVGDAFLPKKDSDSIYIHRNKIASDNRVSNIFIGSRSVSSKLLLSLGKANLGVDGPATIGNFKKLQEKNYLSKHGIYENGKLVAKVCKRCSQQKTVDEYYIQNGRVFHVCKKCTNALDRSGEEGGKTFAKALRKQGLRKCSKCRQIKQVNEFRQEKPGERPDRTCSVCKSKVPQVHEQVMTS